MNGCACVYGCGDVAQQSSTFFLSIKDSVFQLSLTTTRSKKLMGGGRLRCSGWFIIFLIVDRGEYECWDCKDQ